MLGSDTCTVAIDLQQVLFIPSLTHADMFYLCQLSCYNFCVHVHDTSDSIMCLWHEAEGGRGANHIASCLFRILNATSNITGDKKNLNVWSDNCCTQNKTRMLLFMYIFLVEHSCFRSIEH